VIVTEAYVPLVSFAYYFVMIVVRGKYVYDGFLNTLTCRWWLADVESCNSL